MEYPIVEKGKEIGRLLGMPAATVGTRLARGRAKLKTILQED